MKTFIGYLRICIRHNAFDWVRHDKVARTFLEHNSREKVTRSAFAEAISREAMQFFDKAVKKLPRKERRIVIMKVIDGLCFRDISRKMKVTEVCARTAFWRAKQRLSGFLDYMEAL